MIIYFIIINIIGFLNYYIDKKKAQKGKRRIPEKYLCLVAFIGGALGSLWGMLLWHHKTRHLKFWLLNSTLTIIWLMVILKLYVC